MAAQYITKTHKDKEGKVIEVTYRIDADFIPSKINEISNEFIENYCVAKNEVEWLLTTVNTSSYVVERKDKETKAVRLETIQCDNYPFINLRRDFALKFFPDIFKGKDADKQETFKARLNRLYGKK
jgi:hypothetical protein